MDCIKKQSTVSRASSVVSASESPEEPKKILISLWPEWSDTEVNAEKWDATKASKENKVSINEKNRTEYSMFFKIMSMLVHW